MTTQLRKEQYMDASIPVRPSPSRRLIAWITLIAYIGQPLAVMAQVVADHAAAPQNRPVIDNTANGLPLVQITTPSAAGVSRNQYTQFNVDPIGLILNNSQATVLTQLGGYVAGNPNLAGASARVILNEVTGTNQSSLRGYTEVAGLRAEVVIANPNGISCNGCGFINTSRGVLTTGVPVMGGSGSLDGFRVTGGQIDIGAGGLNGNNTNQLDLIARSVKVNGTLWGSNLNVVTGANQVDYATLGVQLIQGDANKPTVGIDVALLGGMYANKIRLVGTEAGVGVNSLGTLAAQAGDFTLDNQGQITLSSNTSATGNLSINSNTSISNSGTLYSQLNVQIASLGDISNSGTLSAQGSLALTGVNVNSSGTLGAGINANGVVTQNASLTVTASGRIDATGQNLAGGNIALSGTVINLANSRTGAGGGANLIATVGSIDLTSGILQANGAVIFNANGSIINDLGQIAASQFISNSGSLSNRGGLISQTGIANTRITTIGAVDNTGGTIQTNGVDFSLSSQAITNDQGSIAHAGQGILTVNTGALSNNGGAIATNGQANISAASIVNHGGKLIAQKQATLISQGIFDNSALPGAAGGYVGADSLSITANNGKVNNAFGTIEASNGLVLNSLSLTNSGGTIQNLGTAALNISITQGLINTALNGTGGFIGGNGLVNIAAASLDNTGSTFYGKNNLTLQSGGAFSNLNGLVRTDANLNVTAAAALNNGGGRIEANGVASTATVSAASIDNTAGRIANSGTGLTLINGGSQIANSNAIIGGNGNVEINSTDLLNTLAGQIISGGNLALNTSRTLDNSGGKLYAAGSLTLAQINAVLNNTAGNISANGNINLNVSSIDNTNGLIGNLTNGGGSVTLTSSGNLSNSGGKIGSDLDLLISANTIVGNGQAIAGRDAGISLQGNYTNLAGNQIAANRNLSFSTTGNFTNTGALQSVNDLTLSAANITNQGALSAGGKLGASTGILSNTGSIIGGDISIVATQMIENVGTSAFIGASNAAGILELLAPTIQNRDDTTITDTLAQTTIYGLGQIVLAGGKNAGGQYTQANQVLNQSGLIQSGGNMSVYANTLTNTRRVLQMNSTFIQTGPPVSATGYWYSNPTVIPGGQPANWAIGGGANSSYRYTSWTGTTYQNAPSSISPAAQIVSGGNLAPAVTTLQNYWSKVTAGGSIGLTGVTLDQNSWRGATSFMQQGTYTGAWVYQNYKGFYWTPSGSFAQTVNTQLPGYDSTFTANGSIGGTGATIINTAGSSAATPLGGQSGQALSLPGSASVAATPSQTLSVPTPAAAAMAAILTLPSGGLYTTHSTPGQKYLVETNPAFTNQKQWLSSDWYFQHASIDPGTIQKRLGDGFYEQQLVRNQVLSLTGRSVLSNYADEETQFRNMMTSGAKLAMSLNISPGVGLSAEQVARLTDNVIIMETREVAGEKVLVPIVYMAQANQGELLTSGALIAAANINLTDTKGFTNSGTIKADNTLSLSGQSIDNRGGNLQSGGLMALNTSGDIDLTSASLKAGSLLLNAGNDLILGTDAKQTGINVDFGTHTTTLMGRTGSINVAGDALIATGRDFIQTGANLNVGGNLQANVGRDWQIGTVQLNDASRGAANGNQFATSATRNVVSQINVGGQGNIKAGGNFVAQGAQIALSGGGSIQAGGNVMLGAVKDSVSYDSNYSGGEHMGHNQGYRETVTGTALLSNGDLSLQSGGDITFQADDVRAKSLTASVGIVNQSLVNPNAKIRFEGIKALSTSTYTESDKGTFWQSSAGQGGTNETLNLTKITLSGSNASPTLVATGGIVVSATSLPGNDAATLGGSGGGGGGATKTVTVDLHEQAQELAKQPGLGYLADLSKRNDVDWQKFTLAKDNWNYSQSGLTGAGAAIIALVVAVATYGAGSALAGTTAATGAGATTTTLAGTTLATTTTAAATATTAAVATTTYTAAGAAINAAFSTLASQAAVSLINNQGDIGKTLQDLGSKDSVKSVIASMLTAGVGQAYAGTYNAESLVAKTAAGCAAGTISGAGCGSGATSAAAVSTAAWGYNSLVGYNANAGPGNTPAPNKDYPFYQPINGQQPQGSVGNNVIGYNLPGSVLSQGSTISNTLNQVPFINATAGLHDYIFNAYPELPLSNPLVNIGMMLPALAVAIPASLNAPSLIWLTTYKLPSTGKQ